MFEDFSPSHKLGVEMTRKLADAGMTECDNYSKSIPSMIVIAHDIRSLHNVGAIFRSAAAFGVEKLFLTGYTPPPPRKEIAKVALGAERLIPWETGEIAAIIESCKKAGYTVLALEQTPTAKNLADVRQEKVALILGNEVTGVDPMVLALCDGSTVIPMHQKRSLNVSVAAGVAMYVLRSNEDGKL